MGQDILLAKQKHFSFLFPKKTKAQNWKLHFYSMLFGIQSLKGFSLDFYDREIKNQKKTRVIPQEI